MAAFSGVALGAAVVDLVVFVDVANF